MRQRKKPARMVLSHDVGRSATAEKAADKHRVAGPFAGMNQTVANIPKPAHLRAVPTQRPTSALEAGRARKDGARREEKPLFHALKMQQMLTPLSYHQRDKLKEQMAKITSFEELGLMPPVANAVYTQALPDLSEYSPTPVQRLAIPALLSKKGQYEKSKKKGAEPAFDQFLLAAETGSGKTLAYLLPVIEGVRRQEELDRVEEAEREAQEAEEKADREKQSVFDADPLETDEGKPHPSMGRPRALILQPSSELVTQVGKLVKVMGHTIKYKSAPMSAANSPTVIRNRLFNPKGIDIVVSTPHLISSIAEKDPNILGRVQYLVIDEADSLLDRSFSSTTCSIIDRAAPSLKQLILCSATIPRSLDKFLDRRFPQIKRIVTPKLHTIPRRVQLGVVDIEKDPYRGNRDLACADAIWQLGKAVHDDTHLHHTVKHFLVFVNEREKAEELAQFLAKKGIDAVPLTRDTSEQRQAEILSSFTSPARVEGDKKESGEGGRRFTEFVPFDVDESAFKSEGKGSRRLPNTKVLVTTDLGSRGIDTLAVRHVILYDVPHSTIDFVHRLGRLGRMNRRGRGIVLVGKHDRKDVVREVREAMHKGQALI